MTPNEWAKYFRYLASKENEKGEATITVCASLASAADQVEKMSAEIEQLKEALAVSRHETGTVDNALYKYEVLWSACKGWREFDWPEGFSRRTADLIVENAERVLASTGRKEPELTKDKISMKYRLLIAGSDDLHYFDSEIEALREANKINRWWLGRRAVDPENEPLCCATVWEPGQLPGDWPESLPDKNCDHETITPEGCCWDCGKTMTEQDNG